ncbi:MAG: hypothetical protein QHI38_11845 [Armatimonadota bacterium]|nr:hypothetical protein [Armatimonadota bacterium]
MNKTAALICFSVVILAVAGCSALQAADAKTGSLIPPPAISVPYGGKVITEINFSDKDILGVIKQILPAINEVISSLAPALAERGPEAQDEKQLEALQKIDFKGLADAISGIRNVRVLVVKYPRLPNVTELLKQLDSGVAKLGQFSRIIANVGDNVGGAVSVPFSGLLAVYAQADGGGYVGYGSNPARAELYAFRLVGSADIQKLIKWGVETVKNVVEVLKEQPAKTTPAQPPAQTMPELPPAQTTPAPQK